MRRCLHLEALMYRSEVLTFCAAVMRGDFRIENGMKMQVIVDSKDRSRSTLHQEGC